MRKRVLLFSLAIFLLFPSPPLAAGAECGDGNVPKGVWPNCEPCAGGGAKDEVEAILKGHGKILEENLDKDVLSHLENCIAGIRKVFSFDIGLPSIEEILGMVCEVAREYSQEWLGKLDQRVSISGPYGISASGGIGSGGSGGVSSGGIRVQDTSRQAVEAAKRHF